MTYETLTDYNATGIDALLAYTQQTVPEFIPLILVAIFLMATMTSYFTQKKETGRGNFLNCLMAGSWIQMICAIILSLIPNLVNGFTLSVSIVITIAISLWFFVEGSSE